jgi:hypothetical protein
MPRPARLRWLGARRLYKQTGPYPKPRAWDHLAPPGYVGGQDTVAPDVMAPGSGDERDQPAYEGQGLERERRRPVRPGPGQQVALELTSSSQKAHGRAQFDQ